MNSWKNIFDIFCGSLSVCQAVAFDAVFVSYNVCSLYESSKARAVGLAPLGRRTLLEEELHEFGAGLQES